ncbi:MAG TPA: TRAP transporter large permease [Rhodocyclaceae bacterium]|nr:TRAP transporter large permease [Rhodocyclaceae bacterium]
MDPNLLVGLALTAVLVLLVLRVPIAYALGGVATAGLFLFFAWRPGAGFDPDRGLTPALSVIGTTAFNFVHHYPLSMIPLFIGLGHVAYHAGITTDLYQSLRVWLARTPGGLAMASIMGCGGFSAVSGSSVACAAAMGRITVPEMLRYGYDARLATAAVAAGGTLGSLVPPSLLFVIYAIFTEQSVKWLFLAGILPGVLSLLAYLVTTWVWVRLRPQDAPMPDQIYTRADRMRALAGLWPTLLLLGLIIGGMFLGIFTPTEAAGVSLAVAILIGAARRRLRLADLYTAFSETARQTATIFMIALGAKIFVSFAALTRIAPNLLDWVQGTGAPMLVVIAVLVLLYIVLGMFLDSIGILVLTLPFVVPIVDGYGLDLIWFGVVVIKLLEIGLITPPVGLNVFVIKSVAPREVSLEHIFRGIGWFLILDFCVLLAILLFPPLSLLIPTAAG